MAARRAESPFEIGEESIPAGRRRLIEVPLARLPTGTWETVSIQVIHGRRPGPTVFISGAIHGDELNGVAIARRIIPMLDARRLAGTVIVVPVVNVLGFVNQSRYLPDGRDLNRVFPGSSRGSLASRLAHLFMREVVLRCDLGIDLHTASAERVNAPQIRADLDDAETRQLAAVFGAPFSIHARIRDGSLRQAATVRGVRVLLYESGQRQRFDRRSIEIGVAGTLRVLTAAGMGEWDVAPGETPIESRSTRWVRATRSGIADLDVDLGQAVEKGERLGAVGDVVGGRPTRVKATISGHVIARTLNPMVAQGDALVHLAVPGAVEGRDEPAVRRDRRA